MNYISSTFGYLVFLVVFISVALFATKLKREYISKLIYSLIYSIFSLFLYLNSSIVYDYIVQGKYTVSKFDSIEFVVLSAMLITSVLSVILFEGIFFKTLSSCGVMGVGYTFLIYPYSSSNISIIDAVWLIILIAFSGYYMGTVWVYEKWNKTLDILEYNGVKSYDYVEAIRDEAYKVVSLSINVLLALAASIGVSMSILFRSGKEAWNSFARMQSATQMLVGFITIIMGIGIWLVRPYVNIYNRKSILERRFLRNNANGNEDVDYENSYILGNFAFVVSCFLILLTALYKRDR